MESDSQESTTSIEKPNILLVEGTDEKLFFHYFFKFLKESEGHIWDNLDNLQVIDYEGTPNFEKNLEIILTKMSGSEIIQKVGIIRDADTDHNQAFSAIKTVLHRIGITSPDSPLTPTTGHPSINIMIVPETGSGSIEIYFLDSVNQDPATSCVEKYFSCLQPFYDDAKLKKPKNIHKAKLQAFLSSRKVPKASFGGGAQEEYWTYSDPAFSRFKDFLRQLID